eukprot:UN04125
MYGNSKSQKHQNTSIFKSPETQNTSGRDTSPTSTMLSENEELQICILNYLTFYWTFFSSLLDLLTIAVNYASTQ